MMYYGYAGRILHIDLTTRSIRIESTDPDQEQKFIGGFGSCYRMAYNLASPGVDPFSPDNPIVFSAGVLAGTTVPGAIKITAVTKLPLTGTFGWSQGSMAFASMLKWAGYDHMVLTGKADRPVYIKIVDGKIDFCDATHLWGKDVRETTHEMKKENGDSCVLCIGQAGENLVKLSLAMIDDLSTLGQGGLGAVMGSKNLKGIMVYGTQGIRISDKKRFSKAVKELEDRIVGFKQRDMVVQLGMMAGWKALVKEGYISTKHMTEEEVTNIYGIQQYQGTKLKNIGCPGCLVADKEVVHIKGGTFDGLMFPITSYQEIPAFGSTFAIRDLSEAGQLLNMCNRYGISAQTLDGLLDFVIELYEAGLITKEAVGGLEIRRDFKTINRLIEMIVKREGAGDVFADGWTGIIDRFGKECEKHALVNKGSNFIWDPRIWVLGTMEFAQIVSPKGPYSAFGGSPTTVPGLDVEFFKRHCNRVGAGEDQIKRIFDSSLGFNVGRLTRCFEDWVTILTCLGICNRAANDRYYSASVCADLYSAATGIEKNLDQLVEAAERAWTLTRCINVREGFRRKDDIIPEQWFHPLKLSDGKEHVMRDYFGKRELDRKDVEQWLDDYYLERGWDPTSGVPTKERVAALGLESIARDLVKGG